MSSSPYISSSLPRNAHRERESDSVQTAPPAAVHDSVLLGDSLVIRRLRSQVQRIAPYFRTALVRGETGAGKQLVGRAIHALSAGADGPFIVSHASSLAETIAAAEAAPSPHPSPAAALLEAAQSGTLYLEGIGEVPFALQAGLLRFIRASEEFIRGSQERGSQEGGFQERRSAPAHGGRSDFRRAEPNRPDLRILAASHRDLRTLAAIGQFRHDLYTRLAVVEIAVPPLSQRVDDIPLLAAWLLRQSTGHSAKTFAAATLAQLQNRAWPGNLRELDRVVAQAAALAEGLSIEPRHLLALVESTRALSAAPPPVKIERLQDVIQQHVLAVLTRCGGNKLRAAELLGISRSTLYRMLDAASAFAE